MVVKQKELFLFQCAYLRVFYFYVNKYLGEQDEHQTE